MQAPPEPASSRPLVRYRVAGNRSGSPDRDCRATALWTYGEPSGGNGRSRFRGLDTSDDRADGYPSAWGMADRNRLGCHCIDFHRCLRGERWAFAPPNRNCRRFHRGNGSPTNAIDLGTRRQSSSDQERAFTTPTGATTLLVVITVGVFTQSVGFMNQSKPQAFTRNLANQPSPGRRIVR